MKNVKNKTKQNFTKLTQKGGISLIVLVVTIIVILILAAAMILTINNNNPIAEANKARYESDVSNMQAVFTNAVAKVMTHNRATVSITAGSINTVTSGVKETTGEVSYTVTNAMNSENSSGTIVFDKNDNEETTFYTGKKLPIYAAGETKWYVDSEGNISLEVAGVAYGNGEIIKVPFAQTVAYNPTTYYGAKVTNYKTGIDVIDEQVEWQIFYSDMKNIYLISTDYVHYNLLPTVTAEDGTEYALTEYADYMAGFKDILNTEIYAGSEDITDTRIQDLNSSYFKYLADNNMTSKNSNIRAVACMLDIGVWKTFAGDNADYAIGGPTIEMLLKSYSQKYNVDYRAQAVNEKGYKISKDGGTNWAIECSGLLDTSDTQYVINDDVCANGMWIASPVADYYGSMVLHENSIGGIAGYYSYNNALGFRPVVCLNSSIELNSVEEGYEIF